MSLLNGLKNLISHLTSLKEVKPGMSCEEASVLIANIEDLEASVKVEVLDHVKDCPCCGNYHDQIVFLNKKCQEINNLKIKEIDPETLNLSKMDIINKFSKKD